MQMEVPLSSLLSENHVIRLRSSNRREVVEELVDVLVKQGELPEERRKAAIRSIMLRENQSPTGLGGGLAVPHAKLNGIPRFLSAIGISDAGVDFEADDGKAHLIVLLFSQPQTKHAVTHLELLRFISEHFASSESVAAMTANISAEDIIEHIRELEGAAGLEA